MGLEEYQKKRKPALTPEPLGTGASDRSGEPAFVCQKHLSSHLHYDLRLELDGVLKSWAIPKGPSQNPKDKRLAVMVEDHPLEYAGFEGVIPKDNYGAGQVIVWDKGFYRAIETVSREDSDAAMRDGLTRGHLTFIMAGEKLNGEFALVRLRRGSEQDWLLIKANDQFASDIDITLRSESVISGNKVEDIQDNASSISAEDLKTLLQSLGAVSGASLPEMIKPMQAFLITSPFDSPNWGFEIKWDGYRAIAQVRNGKVSIYSRNNLTFNDRFPAIVDAFAKSPHDMVVDGEIVALDEKGRPDFQLLQSRRSSAPIIYYVFDVLFYDGYDLRKLDYKDRKVILANILPLNDGISISEHIVGTGIAFFEAARRQGLEGIMAKQLNSIYSAGRRSRHWLKIKTSLSQDAVIGGFTATESGGPGFGALILGVYENRVLVHIGQVGTGFGVRSQAEILKSLQPLIQTNCPFSAVPKTRAPVTWVKPIIVCEVKFQEWTDSVMMRQPVFMRLRDDKNPRSVIREVPKPLSELWHI